MNQLLLADRGGSGGSLRRPPKEVAIKIFRLGSRKGCGE